MCSCALFGLDSAMSFRLFTDFVCSEIISLREQSALCATLESKLFKLFSYLRYDLPPIAVLFLYVCLRLVCVHLHLSYCWSLQMGCIFLCCLLGMSSSSLSIRSWIQKTWSLFHGCFKAGRCQFLLRNTEETSLTPFIFLHLLRLGSRENPTGAWPGFSASCASGWMDTFMWQVSVPRQALVRMPFLILTWCSCAVVQAAVLWWWWDTCIYSFSQPLKVACTLYAIDSCSRFAEEGQKAGSSLIPSVSHVTLGRHLVIIPHVPSTVPISCSLSCRTLAGH